MEARIMQFANPQNDIAFKKIFGSEKHKNILIGFLNTVLDLQNDNIIESIEYLNTFQLPDVIWHKYSLLDIQATDQAGRRFIVEMQVENAPYIEKRFLYYAARVYTSQIKRGDSYKKLQPTIFIAILNFVLIPESEDDTAKRKAPYLSQHIILDIETKKNVIKDLAFYFIELPKFHKQADQLENLLDQWIYFLKYASDLEVIPDHVTDAPLKDAYESAERFHWSDAEWNIYDYNAMKQGDEEGRLEKARAKGELAQGQKLVTRLLKRRLGFFPPSVSEQIEQLTLAQLEALGDALLDFQKISDLEQWLANG